MKTKSRLPELEDRIDLYVKGALTQAQADELWIDAIQYDYVDFLKSAATIRKVAVATTHEVRSIPRIGIRTRPKLTTLTAAAAAVAVTAGSLWLYQSTSESTPFTPLSRLETGLVRSGTQAATSFEARVRSAVLLAVQGSYGDAMVEFDRLVSEANTTDERALLWIHQGTAQYNQGEWNAAESTFGKVVQMNEVAPALQEEARWYLANTLLQTGETDRAVRMLESVIPYDGAYSRAARTALDGLHMP